MPSQLRYRKTRSNLGVLRASSLVTQSSSQLLYNMTWEDGVSEVLNHQDVQAAIHLHEAIDLRTMAAVEVATEKLTREHRASWRRADYQHKQKLQSAMEPGPNANPGNRYIHRFENLLPLSCWVQLPPLRCL